MSISGLKDIDREVLKHVDDEELLKICTINRQTWNEVCDDNFLRRRITSKYPGIDKFKKENETWKQFFLRFIYYTSKMRDVHNFEYTGGDFKKQYEILKEYTGPNSILIESSRQGELNLVKYAIENGAHVNAVGSEALKSASGKGHLDIVRYLLEFGANIHSWGDEPLRYASTNEHFEVAKYLIKEGANIHANRDEALWWASIYGNLDMVKFLVERGADTHADGDRPLRAAVRYGHLDIVKYLIENGANINYEVLKEAKEYEQFHIVEYLSSLA